MTKLFMTTWITKLLQYVHLVGIELIFSVDVHEINK